MKTDEKFQDLQVDPAFTGQQKKMLFVSIWTAFAFSLGILNANKRRTFKVY